MPDISKCTGKGCRVKHKCYRHTSESSFWQAWTDYSSSIKNGKCDRFIPNNQTRIK